MELRNVVLVDGMRSAFGRGARGKLVATRLDEAGARVLRALLDRHPKVTDRMIEDVGLGTVNPRGEYSGLGTVPRLAGLPFEVCSFTSNRQCGSSMETLHRVAMSIAVGSIDCGIALGIERMGRTLMPSGGPAPKVPRNQGPNRRLLDMNEAQRTMAPDHSDYFTVPIPEYVLKSPPLQNMPQTAQNVIEMYNLTRQELDEFSAESHRRTAAAYERGIYKDEIVPLEVESPVYDKDGNWVSRNRRDHHLRSR